MRAFDASFVESAYEEEEKVGAYVKDHAFLSPHLIRVIEEYRAVEQEYEKAVGRRLGVEKGVHALLPRCCGYLTDTYGELQPSVYLPSAKRAVEVVERECGKESAEAASTYITLGGVCFKMG